MFGLGRRREIAHARALPLGVGFVGGRAGVADVRTQRRREHDGGRDEAEAEHLGKAFGGDVFVQEAFGTAHRAHASTAGIANYLPCVSGFLIEKEVKFLGSALQNPQRPFVAIMGGAKVGDKIKVIENLLTKGDTLINGGGMSYTL